MAHGPERNHAIETESPRGLACFHLASLLLTARGRVAGIGLAVSSERCDTTAASFSPKDPLRTYDMRTDCGLPTASALFYNLKAVPSEFGTRNTMPAHGIGYHKWHVKSNRLLLGLAFVRTSKSTARLRREEREVRKARCVRGAFPLYAPPKVSQLFMSASCVCLAMPRACVHLLLRPQRAAYTCLGRRQRRYDASSIRRSRWRQTLQ